MELKLSDVAATALIPLANRASETARKHPRVRDEKAMEIIATLGINTKHYDKIITHECVIARTILFDQAVKKLLLKYPDAVCINMGCGLDNRFQRIDNGQIIWFDIDLPNSIAVRKKVYTETDRRKMIGADVLDIDWIDIVKTMADQKTVIVIAEGLFMYFSQEQTKAILNHLTSFFEKGFLVVEMMHPFMMNEKRHETVKYTNAAFGWGTKSGKEFEALDSKMKLILEKSFSEQLKKSTLPSKIIGILTGKYNNRLAVFQWQNNTSST